jgi:hypothetical protein
MPAAVQVHTRTCGHMWGAGGYRDIHHAEELARSCYHSTSSWDAIHYCFNLQLPLKGASRPTFLLATSEALGSLKAFKWGSTHE